jgi:hypothetical protein
MPRPRLVALSVFLLIAVTHSSSSGQEIPSPYVFIANGQAWEIFAGMSDLNPGELEIGPRDGTTFGGRYAAAFSGALNLDVDGTFFSSKRKVYEVRPGDNILLGESDIDVLLLDARLRINLTGHRTWNGLQPFVLFGGGIAFTTFTDRAWELLSGMPPGEWYEFGVRFAGTFGAGTAYHLTDKISLRLDGVLNLWKIQTPLGWQTLLNDPLDQNTEGEWVAGTTLRLGAAWRF